MAHRPKTFLEAKPRTNFDFRAAGITDTGKVREINEDAFLVRSDMCVWAVADGMGGHDAGDFASQTVLSLLSKVRPWDKPKPLLNDILSRLEDANAVLLKAGKERGGGTVGSTVVCLIALRDRVMGIWCGDSRIYRANGSGLEQISTDHSVVQRLVDAGLIEADEAEEHPQAHVLTNAIGVAEDVEIDREQRIVEKGDRFLLCSDGLTRTIPEDVIYDILMNGRDPAGICERLMDAALKTDARDNITALCVLTG